MISQSLGNLKQVKRLFLPRLENIHHQWLAPLLSKDWLEKCLHSEAAGRLINQKLHKHYDIPLPRSCQLKPEQYWLLLDIESQNELARTIGEKICIPLIRTLVNKQCVHALKSQLGSDNYFLLFEQSAIKASGPDRAQLLKHLDRGNLKIYLTAVGIAALQQTIDPENEFFRVRMKFAFPKLSWKIRPQLNDIDFNSLEEFLLDQRSQYLSGVESDEQ